VRPIEVSWLGTLPYDIALDLQRRLVEARRADAIPDQLLLLEHPHVITLGSSSSAANVLADEEQRTRLGIELFETGRGGDVTYHGPGQLVGYPILDLKPDRCDLHRYVRDIEEALIRAVANFGVTAHRLHGRTGVWVGDAKVAAIGVRVSSGWITSHGFALNVATNLDYFSTIVPCGIADKEVASLEQLVATGVDMSAVREHVAVAFAATFERVAVRGTSDAELARLAGADTAVRS
jgi:lipoyl(octanoyl) transferase